VQEKKYIFFYPLCRNNGFVTVSTQSYFITHEKENKKHFVNYLVWDIFVYRGSKEKILLYEIVDTRDEDHSLVCIFRPCT